VNLLAENARIAPTYDRPGPFVTVYLDATRSTENAEHEIEVRWRDVREELRRHGADEQSLEAIQEGIAGDVHTPGRHGLVLVAARGELCFADPFPGPPAQSTGRVAALPHLVPYLAQRATDVPHIVVVADRTGADIISVAAGGATEKESVAGEAQHPISRTGRNTWSERQFQNRVENNWEKNARNVADEVTRLTRQLSAPLVVVAGEVRASHMVADDLASALGPGVTVTLVDEGGRAPGASPEALESAVHEQVLRHVWRERREVLEHLRQNLGRHEYAVAGAAEVAEALRMSQVDTVVLSDDPSSTLQAWVGPQPTEFGLDDAEATTLGISEVDHDRYDAALLRAVVGTGARLVVTPGGHQYLPDGIGALLRYEVAS
jgi:hypothetical protein